MMIKKVVLPKQRVIFCTTSHAIEVEIVDQERWWSGCVDIGIAFWTILTWTCDILINHKGSSRIPNVCMVNRVSEVRCFISSGIDSQCSQPHKVNDWRWFLNFSMPLRLGKECSSSVNRPSFNVHKNEKQSNISHKLWKSCDR